MLSSWNSSHDNAFVWLMLVEALLLPVLLCSTDLRLKLALRRSLRCNLDSLHAMGGPSNHHQWSTLDGFPLHSDVTSPQAPPVHGHRRDHLNGSQSGHLLACSFLTHPGFLFAETNKRYQLADQPSLHHTCPATSANKNATRDLLHSNFALVTKGHSLAAALNRPRTQSAGWSWNLEATDEPEVVQRGANKLANSAGLELALRVRDRHQKRKLRTRKASSIMQATKRLFGLDRQARSGYLVSGHSTTTEHDDTTASSRGRAQTGSRRSSSPATFSLSTLIRKFNQENYSKVCEQYEQRKRHLASQPGPSELAFESNNRTESNDKCPEIQLTFDHKLKPESSCDRSEDPHLPEEIFYRKGGLYYNYSLEDQHKQSSGRKPQGLLKVDSKKHHHPSKLHSKSARKSPTGSEVKHKKQVSSVESNVILTGSTKRYLDLACSNDRLSRLETPKPNGAVQVVATTKASQPGLGSAGSVIATRPQQMNPPPPPPPPSSSKSHDTGKQQVMVQSESQSESERPRPSNMRIDKLLESSSPIRCGQPEMRAKSGTTCNNEPIISSITSVQELLDKMNGIMAGQPESSQVHLSAARLSKLPKLAKVGQLVAAIESGHWDPYETTTNQTGTLDDALSLASVSSEFEYHNINQLQS